MKKEDEILKARRAAREALRDEREVDTSRIPKIKAA